MNRSETVDHIRIALSSVLGREIPDLTESSRLFEDLALDSTSVIELLMSLEDTIDLQIDPDDLEPDVFRTVGSLTDYIQNSMTPSPAV
ncbi:MAG TPA: acyl carrier protein [Actinocrinis sp.]|jgi:acyl carrier protein|uniref:acyl carrier protein n=1 Tax=Actinocrinis sp. TaxID=1920516 RepID=UPI002DDCC6B1|nr:acyl carrier protein [Actinocrinis sp.]HEV3170969.1 acyl carrier protein [Actinocrinis sp.]